jgi:DNA-binding LacI/PurR family transcriptional regulator
MRAGKATMSDVAKLAGVSPMTVSNVLNNRAGVNDAYRASVLAAVLESGYEINAAARALRSGRSGVIGLAVPQIENPYYGMLADLLIEEAEHRGWQIAIEQTYGVAAGEAAAVAQSRSLHLDGLILAAVELDPLEPPWPAQGYPVTMLGEQDLGGRFDHVMMPNEAGTAAATEHLIAQGCRRIAVVTGPDLDRLTVATRRYNGYRTALERHGIRPDPDLRIVLESFSLDGGRCAGHRIADVGRDIDGVVALTDVVAIGIMRGLHDRGMTVPDDVRVIGFDGIDQSEHCIPALSTVATDHRWMAARALDLVISHIEDHAQPPVQYTAPFEIVRRESTA